MPNPQSSLADFYSSITDRRQVWEQIQYEKKNNPVMQGLDELQVGKVINDIIGAPEGSRFDMFDSKTRWLDAAGYYTNELFKGAPTTPANYLAQMSGKSTRNWGDVGGDIGEVAGSLLGAKGSDLELWKQTGESLPGGLGTLALGAIPVVGPYATVATAFGMGENDALSQGASEGKAAAVGALDAAVNLLFLKASGPITDKFAGSILGKTMGVGARDALAESSGLVLKEGTRKGEQIAGRALVELANKTGAITSAQATTNKWIAEGATAAVQSAVGVSENLVHQGIIDPEGTKANLANPHYWGTVLASEGVMGVLGTTMGNIREANHLNNYAVGETAVEKPIFKEATTPAEDVKVVSKSVQDLKIQADKMLKESQLKRVGTEAIAPLAADAPTAISDLANSLISTGKVGLNENAAQVASELLATKPTEVIEGILHDAIVQNNTEQPEASMQSVYGGIHFKPVDPKAPTILTLQDLLGDHTQLVERFNSAEDRASVSRIYNMFKDKFTEHVKDFDIVYDEHFTSAKKLGYQSFFESSGIAAALQTAKTKLRFVDSTRNSDWFVKLASSPEASAHQITDDNGNSILFVNSPNANHINDPHEIGHVVDFTLDKGGFGLEAKTEWEALRNKYAPHVTVAEATSALQKGKLQPNVLSERIGKERAIASGMSQAQVDKINFNTYYSTSGEWAAQAFEGYMLNKPNKFKSFIQEHFPNLHKVFNDVVEALRKSFTKNTVPTRTDVAGAWHPGQADAQIFFESLFNRGTAASTEAEVRALLKKHSDKVTPKITESFLLAITGGRTLAGKAMAFEAMNRWVKESTPIEADILASLEFVNQVNKLGMSLEGLAKSTCDTLPNVRRLMGIQPDNVKAGMVEKLAAITDPKQLLETQEYLRDLKNLPERGKRALTAVDNVLSNKITLLEKEVGQVSLEDKAIQQLQMDSIIGKWYRGELPGQNGRFMWEPRHKETFDYSAVSRDDLRHPDERRMAREILTAKEFPILSKALRSTKTGAVTEGFVPDIKGSATGKGKVPVKQFATEAEAYEYATTKNATGDNFGYSYAPKAIIRGTKDAKTKVWGVYYKKDSRKSIVAEYRDDLTSVTDALHAFNDDPKTKEYVKSTQERLLTQAYYDDLENHIERVTRFNFEQWRTGKKEVFPEQMQKALTSMYQYIGEKGVHFFPQLMKDLGMKSSKVEDMLLGFVKLAQTNKKDMMDLLLFSHEPVNVMFQNYKNYMKVWLDADLQANLKLMERGEMPALKNNKFVWQNVERGSSPLEDPNFHEQVSVMQHAMPGGILRKNNADIRYAGASPRTLLGKVMSAIEHLHTMSYGGVMNYAESHKWFKEPARYLEQEEPIQNDIGSRGLRCLRGKMEKVVVDGEERLIPVKNDERADDRAYIAVNSSQKLKPIVNRMQLMQNEAGGCKFEDVASNNLKVGKNESPEDKQHRKELAQEAHDLIAKNFDTNNPKHQQELADIKEYLERTYATQREIASIRYEREMNQHMMVTAIGIYKSLDYKGTPEQARDFATSLMFLDLTDPKHEVNFVKKLVDPVEEGGLGWDALRAISFKDKWLAGVKTIKELSDWMQKTPGYITEVRQRRWHVPYVEKGAKPDVVGTGLRDFDTEEEAWKFINDAKSQGIKVQVKAPKDTHEANSRLRPGSAAFDEVVHRVAQARKDLLEMVLDPLVESGAIDKEKQTNIIKVLSGMAEDISADSVSARLKDILVQQRRFKPGREHLDMAYQQEEGLWRMGIQYARMNTDAGFQLFMDDPRIASDTYGKSKFNTAKDAMRTADGKGQRIASRTAFSYFILGNLSSAMIEAAQWPLSLSHILVEHGASILDAFRIPALYTAKAGRASMQRIGGRSDKNIWEPQHWDLIQKAESQNRLGVRPLNDISTDNTEAKLKMNRELVNPGAKRGPRQLGGFMARAAYGTLNKFYAHFSRINAEISLVASYEVLKKAKFGTRKTLTLQEHTQLMEDAMHVSNKANGSWGRSNRPWWFDTKSPTGRTVAQLAWSMQGYASNFVANHLRLLKNSIGAEELGLTKEEITRSRKALAVMTTMQIAGLGVMGHTLAGGLSKLLTTTFGIDPEAATLDWLNGEDENGDGREDNQGLADMIMYGGLHALDVPLDVQARMSVSGLGPLSSYEGWNASSFGGPLMSTLGNLIDGWNTVTKGDGSPESYMRWGLGMAPTGVQRMLRMALFDDGKVFNKAGRMIMEPTLGEKLSAYTGFAPKRYTDYMRAKTKSMEALAQDGVERASAAQQIYSANASGDKLKALSLLNSLSSRLGIAKQDLANRVADLTAEQVHGPQQVAGSGPNAQRATRLFKSPLPQASNQAIKITKLKALNDLEMLPRDWQKQLHHSAMLDTAEELLPNDPLGARNSLRNPLFKSTVLSMLSQKSAQRPVGLSGFLGLPSL